jgi:lipopolysaccharide transport system permease protein
MRAEISIVNTPSIAARDLTIVEPRSGWQLFNWKELKQYRDLFYFLVWRDVKIQYKQTVLGFLWAIIQPLFSMVVFSTVFGRMAKVPSDGIPYPLFAFAALLPWTYFANSLTQSSQSLIADANLLTKVYFPRVIIPMTPVLAKLVDLFIAFGILIVMMVYYGIHPSLNLLLLPLLLALLIMTAAGTGLWLSAMAIQYRDIKFIMTFAVQLLMYAAPVVWPASLVPGRYRLIYGLYPMAGIIDGFRSALLGKPISWDLIEMGSLTTVLLLVSGLLYFRRTEKVFADVA